MYIYTPNEDPVFESLKTFVLDESSLEPIIPEIASGPKLFGELNGMFGKTHTEKTKQMLSEKLINKVAIKDQTGQCKLIDKNDPRYLSGELTGVTKGTVTVRDSNGNMFRVSYEDPRYLSGELVPVAKGKRYKQKTKTNKNKGTVLVFNSNLEYLRVKLDDPRYLSGELKHFTKYPKNHQDHPKEDGSDVRSNTTSRTFYRLLVCYLDM